ncbi:MAG: cytochrome c oxidase assembly protein, partial [Betaproteobacteria bacterium]|nr:cytochrome c oxidase assembly protein [Betaproteobacteria bacterium]
MSNTKDNGVMASTVRDNSTMMRKLLVVTCVMFGFGFAMVPFYKKLCEVTGLNNVLRADEVSNTQIDTARTVTMQFDTNLRNDMPWTFQPVERSVTFHPGELVQVDFEVRNNSDRAITGQAIPSWGPQVAGRHLKKLDCFCFTQQTLQPHEVRRMPVVFVIEKTLPEEVTFVTMSYTFFQVEGRAASASRESFQVEGRAATVSLGPQVEGRAGT